MPARELDKTTYKPLAELKAYYRFESGALTTDSSTNARTLTAIGTPTETTGYFGGGVELASASSQAYSIADSSDMKPTGNFTVGAWIKTSTTGTQKGVFQSWHGTNLGGILFDIVATNFMRIGVGSNTGAGGFTDVYSSTNVCDGNWHFVVARYNGSIVQIFVDGKLENGTARATGPAYNATNYVRVGCENDTGTNQAFFNGTLDDVFFYNGIALSNEAIKEIYEGRSVGEFQLQPNLSALYHLNGSSQDFSGNNNNGTDTAITYSFANGKFFQGAGFNGSSSLISYTPPNITTSITFGGWFRFNTVNSNTRGMFQNYQQNANPNGWSLFLGSTNVITAVVGKNTGVVAGTDYQEVSTGTVSANVWYFVVATYNTSSLTIYLNGRSVQSLTAPSTITNPNVGRIGVRNVSGSNTGFLDGQADELFVFNRALSQQEISRYYQWSLGRFAQTL